MPAYAYPITIKRDHQVIRFDEAREIEHTELTLAALAWVGDGVFSITDKDERFSTVYVVTASRTRYETDEERDKRVAGEESYMAEYCRRQALKKT